MTSRPLRARGLNLPVLDVAVAGEPSRPLRARGLKQRAAGCLPPIDRVAPLAGAWIET